MSNLTWNDVKGDIAVTCITAEQMRQSESDLKEHGVKAPGWYWTFKKDWSWWRGPQASEDAAWLSCQQTRWWETSLSFYHWMDGTVADNLMKQCRNLEKDKQWFGNQLNN
jgi:hypothetical protein